MLQNWMESVEPSQRIPTLRSALKKADLGELEEKYLPREFHTEVLDPVRNELMKDRHFRLSNEFVKYFFTLEILGKDAMRKGLLVGGESGIEKSIDISTSSSHLAAVGLFTLQNLRYLDVETWDVEFLDDDFYKGMCAAASQSKIESFTHHISFMARLGPDASLHYARALFSMPNLKSLKLDRLMLSDEFFSTMATEVSKSKIETFKHSLCNTPLGPDASIHYARGLFSMPNLKSLKLNGLNLSDEFYSTMATEASKSKIESYTQYSQEHLGPDASLHYARGLFSMPNLKSLKLNGLKLSDEYYSAMATEASKSKIESYTQYSQEHLGPDASLHYARALFSMPNLKSLKVTGLELSDDYYLTMATETSQSKIQSLDMREVTMTQPILHSILSLKHLQSLAMHEMDFVDKDDEEILNPQTSSVDELTLDGSDVTNLWKLGLHTSCPQVRKLKLQWFTNENVSSDIVTKACSPFHHLTHLHTRGYSGTIDPESFCNAIITSCPQLSKLSIHHLDLHNEKAIEIIGFMKTHPHLTSLELDHCETDIHLDPLIAEVNSEGKLTVTVTHNWQKEEMSSITKMSPPTMQESSSEEEEGGGGGGGGGGGEEEEEEETEGEKEEKEGEEEAKEDQNSVPEKFLYEGVSSEGNATPIKMECCKSIGVEGGKLQLDSFRIELEIPPGAIDSETPQDIALRVLTDTPDRANSEDEISVCFGVQCLAPDGMVLKSPVTFTIPHCAILSRLYNVKAILYCGEGEYTPGAVVKERIQLPLSGIPSCVVMEDVLKFRVNHFTWWFITFSKNDSLQGKRLCCLPMICTKMPVERTPVILHAHLYDDLMGNKEYAIQRWIKGLFSSKESWLEEELKLGYEKVHSETQIFIEPSEVDLTLMCAVNKGTPEKKMLSYMKMFRLGHNCMPFELDLRNQPDTIAVSLKVGQDDETELLFPITFTSCMERESSVKGTEVGESKLTRQNDFDEMLKTVAKRVAKQLEIDDLGKALGFTPEEISRYIDTNHKGREVTCDGTLLMLRDWRKKQTRETEGGALKAALEESDQIHLANELFGT